MKDFCRVMMVKLGSFVLVLTTGLAGLVWISVSLPPVPRTIVGVLLIELCGRIFPIIELFPRLFGETLADHDLDRAKEIIAAHRPFFAVTFLGTATATGIWLGLTAPASPYYFIIYAIYKFLITSHLRRPDWWWPVSATATCGLTMMVTSYLFRE